jgi:ComF family protein
VELLSPLRHLIDFCYPPRCAVCDGTGRSESPLCEGCFDALRQAERSPACDRCAMPVAQFGAPCPYCFGEGLSPYEGILRLGLYREPIRHLIHQIKYHGQWTLAEMLADRLLEQKPVQALLEQTDVILPVPLHPWRQMIRGFNQAEVIARRLSRRSGVKLRRPIVRLKATETQTHLHSKVRRMDNLRDAFGLLRPGDVTDQHVVVIDDVTTTGATLHHAGKTLKEANPASLCAIVIAVADPQGRDFEAI